MSERVSAGFVAVLLAMLGFLMASHLGLLWLGAAECDEQARILFDHQRTQMEAGEAPTPVRAENAECNALESDFADAAAQYIAVILALLSGAGFAAGRAAKPPD